MPIVALVLLGLLLVSVRLNLALQRRRVGGPRFTLFGGAKVGSAEWWSGLLIIAAFAGVALGAVLDLEGALNGWSPLDALGWQVAGLVAWLFGAALATWAKQAMGASWRIGVDSDESLALVTAGPFRVVRNPIYVGLFMMLAGWALLAPNVVTLAAFACIVTAYELLVRRVEEPYLRQVHGQGYYAYCRRTGRFVPHLGCRPG